MTLPTDTRHSNTVHFKAISRNFTPQPQHGDITACAKCRGQLPQQYRKQNTIRIRFGKAPQSKKLELIKREKIRSCHNVENSTIIVKRNGGGTLSIFNLLEYLVIIHKKNEPGEGGGQRFHEKLLRIHSAWWSSFCLPHHRSQKIVQTIKCFGGVTVLVTPLLGDGGCGGDDRVGSFPATNRATCFKQ